jgi:O-antigen ligase
MKTYTSRNTRKKSFMRTLAFWLSLAMIFAIPWEYMASIGGLGLRIPKMTGLLLASFWVITVIVTGEFRRPHVFHVAAFLFGLWNATSIFWSIDTEETANLALTYAQLVALVFILWDLYTSPEDLRAGLQVYVLGAYLSIVSTFINYLAGRTYSSGRTSATGFNPNNLGLTLALGIPVAWHLATSTTGKRFWRWVRWGNYLYIPAATLAILLSASRGSLVAAVPALVFTCGSLVRFKALVRVLILAALVSTLFALRPFIPGSAIQRLATTGVSVAQGDIGGRARIWQEGLAVFAERPILGVGSGAFRGAVESNRVAHNSFLSILTELGLVGFVLFAVILGIAAYQAVLQPRWDAIFWLAVLAVWALGLSVHTWEDRKPTWLFLGLVVVAAGLPVRGDPSLASRGSGHQDA